MTQLEELVEQGRLSLKSILRNGDIITTISNQNYIYIAETKEFKSSNSLFYLHNLDDLLQCGIAYREKDKYNYSIKEIHRSNTISKCHDRELIVWER